MPQTSRGGAVVACQFRCLVIGGSNPSPATRTIYGNMESQDNNPIEQRAADEILQQPSSITVNGIEYHIPPVTLATLILASKEISRLPDKAMDSNNVVFESMARAEEYRSVADMLAVLMLGSKGLTERRKERRSHLFGLLHIDRETEVDRKSELSNRIMEEWSFSQMYSVFKDIVRRMRLRDFFALTVSLAEVNMLRQTRGTVTTASGQQSQESSRPTE